MLRIAKRYASNLTSSTPATKSFAYGKVNNGNTFKTFAEYRLRAQFASPITHSGPLAKTSFAQSQNHLVVSQDFEDFAKAARKCDYNE